MSWPGADESSGDSGEGYQHDRPTDLASIGIVKNGRLVGFNEEQADPGFEVDEKPRSPAPIIENCHLVGRLLSPAEADAFAYHRSKLCSRATWAPPAVLLTAAYYTNQGRSTFRFPFYTPKPASFNPSSFPSASMAILKGQSAVRLWHVLRFGAYGFLSQYIVKIVVFSFAQAGYLASISGDARLKAVREEMKPPRKARSERSRLPSAGGPADTAAVSSSPSAASNGWDSPAPQTPAQSGWTPQAPQPPQSAPQDDDDSYLFDDASPVAPSQRERPSAGSPQSSGGGSAWDRIRQQAKSEEGARWNPRQQQNGAPGNRQTTSEYTYTPAEQEKAPLRSRLDAEPMNKQRFPSGLVEPRTQPALAVLSPLAAIHLTLTSAGDRPLRRIDLPATHFSDRVLLAAPAATTTRTPLVITSFPSIPLTTTFTPPSAGCGGIYSPPQPNVLIIDHSPSCLPPSFSTSDSSFFYSPGIACPSGYWTACHDTTGVSSITTVTCCPTYGDISLSCVPRPTSLSSVWETLFCTWQAPQSPGTVVAVTMSADNDRTSTVNQAVTFPGGVNAYGVRMVYESSDMEAATASTTSDGSSAAEQTTSTSDQTGTSSPVASDDAAAATTADSGSGLSTGATIAIGVVVPVVVIAAVVIGLAIWWRRRKRQQPPPSAPSAPSEVPDYDYTSPTATQYTGEHVGMAKQPAEHYYYSGYPQQPVHEMPGSLQAVELPGPTQDHHYMSR
ncbi:hypothetical protein CHGG_09094 [Chaetomium globosum CBS 148.51]|uniref:Uncharacterized protein n=1 Tax=Chaetomium globosum (strain ATCC 6205 / CBS 148.51 / DSM 1962 / NBRC 6347 / NRRL 1970) TaxID=306901 RepID=Q2GSG0_CHAGB|nr:uncharacterized protein CHGG_09094 [Chaetomium globosum CBS 148.51]EAQ85080.1 hypothetical protein CHGG_09094 [Chaetomium globosum CBS 148.51]